MFRINRFHMLVKYNSVKVTVIISTKLISMYMYSHSFFSIHSYFVKVLGSYCKISFLTFLLFHVSPKVLSQVV